MRPGLPDLLSPSGDASFIAFIPEAYRFELQAKHVET